MLKLLHRFSQDSSAKPLVVRACLANLSLAEFSHQYSIENPEHRREALRRSGIIFGSLPDEQLYATLLYYLKNFKTHQKELSDNLPQLRACVTRPQSSKNTAISLASSLLIQKLVNGTSNQYINDITTLIESFDSYYCPANKKSCKVSHKELIDIFLYEMDAGRISVMIDKLNKPYDREYDADILFSYRKMNCQTLMALLPRATLQQRNEMGAMALNFVMEFDVSTYDARKKLCETILLLSECKTEFTSQEATQLLEKFFQYNIINALLYSSSSSITKIINSLSPFLSDADLFFNKFMDASKTQGITWDTDLCITPLLNKVSPETFTTRFELELNDFKRSISNAPDRINCGPIILLIPRLTHWQISSVIDAIIESRGYNSHIRKLVDIIIHSKSLLSLTVTQAQALYSELYIGTDTVQLWNLLSQGTRLLPQSTNITNGFVSAYVAHFVIHNLNDAFERHLDKQSGSSSYLFICQTEQMMKYFFPHFSQLTTPELDHLLGIARLNCNPVDRVLLACISPYLNEKQRVLVPQLYQKIGKDLLKSNTSNQAIMKLIDLRSNSETLDQTISNTLKLERESDPDVSTAAYLPQAYLEKIISFSTQRSDEHLTYLLESYELNPSRKTYPLLLIKLSPRLSVKALKEALSWLEKKEGLDAILLKTIFNGQLVEKSLDLKPEIESQNNNNAGSRATL